MNDTKTILLKDAMFKAKDLRTKLFSTLMHSLQSKEYERDISFDVSRNDLTKIVFNLGAELLQGDLLEFIKEWDGIHDKSIEDRRAFANRLVDAMVKSFEQDFTKTEEEKNITDKLYKVNSLFNTELDRLQRKVNFEENKTNSNDEIAFQNKITLHSISSIFNLPFSSDQFVKEIDNNYTALNTFLIDKNKLVREYLNLAKNNEDLPKQTQLKEAFLNDFNLNIDADTYINILRNFPTNKINNEIKDKYLSELFAIELKLKNFQKDLEKLEYLYREEKNNDEKDRLKKVVDKRKRDIVEWSYKKEEQRKIVSENYKQYFTIDTYISIHKFIDAERKKINLLDKGTFQIKEIQERSRHIKLLKEFMTNIKHKPNSYFDNIRIQNPSNSEEIIADVIKKDKSKIKLQDSEKEELLQATRALGIGDSYLNKIFEMHDLRLENNVNKVGYIKSKNLKNKQVAMELIIKVPLHNNVIIDRDLRIKMMEDFLEKTLPNNDILFTAFHGNETVNQNDNDEEEGAHVHCFVSLKDRLTGQYDIWNHIISVGDKWAEENDLPKPSEMKIEKFRYPLAMQYVQQSFYVFVNKFCQENNLDYTFEITPDSKERGEARNAIAQDTILPKSKRLYNSFNYNKIKNKELMEDNERLLEQYSKLEKELSVLKEKELSLLSSTNDLKLDKISLVKDNKAIQQELLNIKNQKITIETELEQIKKQKELLQKTNHSLETEMNNVREKQQILNNVVMPKIEKLLDEAREIYLEDFTEEFIEKSKNIKANIQNTLKGFQSAFSSDDVFFNITKDSVITQIKLLNDTRKRITANKEKIEAIKKIEIESKQAEIEKYKLALEAAKSEAESEIAALKEEVKKERDRADLHKAVNSIADLTSKEAVVQKVKDDTEKEVMNRIKKEMKVKQSSLLNFTTTYNELIHALSFPETEPDYIASILKENKKQILKTIKDYKFELDMAKSEDPELAKKYEKVLSGFLGTIKIAEQRANVSIFTEDVYVVKPIIKVKR